VGRGVSGVARHSVRVGVASTALHPSSVVQLRVCEKMSFVRKRESRGAVPEERVERVCLLLNEPSLEARPRGGI
jgi:hypothetical protein